MRALALLAAVFALGGVAVAQDREIVRTDLPGRLLFEHKCAPCHGAGPGDDGSHRLPATEALSRKYEGRLPGELELRGELTEPVIRVFVRRGSGAMPAFRTSELSDDEIAQIADYIRATSRNSNQ